MSQPEIKSYTPEIVHQISDAIRKTGKFRQDLSSQDIEGLMRGVVGGMLQRILL